jgi:enoyl-CoA hydratase/carnithine racemase
MEYKTILADEDCGVATITLNRPDRLNTYVWRMGVELRHAICAFEVRDDIRAIVVTGAGRAFCAGADMAEGAATFGGGPDEQQRVRDERRRLAGELKPATNAAYWEMTTPIIGAINGPAVGAGLTIPMQWDMRIVAEDAKLAFAFNRRGVIPELGAEWLVPRVVGVARAFDLLVTGRTFSGRYAAEIGLANEAVPTAEVLARAHGVARDIATNVAPASATLVKQMIYRFLDEPERDRAERLVEQAFAWTTQQADAREGPVAFLEKREPRWKLAKNSEFPDELLGRRQECG